MLESIFLILNARQSILIQDAIKFILEPLHVKMKKLLSMLENRFLILDARKSSFDPRKDNFGECDQINFNFHFNILCYFRPMYRCQWLPCGKR